MDTILIVNAILEKAGYLCRTAANVAAAQELFAKIPFDLLLTDMDMPGASGTDLIRFARKHFPQTTAMMVTDRTT